jgi:hypothetical protein
MNLHCEDRERIFLDGTPEEWAALEHHAVSCELCAEELLAWQAVSDAAMELRNHEDDPALWSRIAGSLEVPLAELLAEQTAQGTRRESRWAFPGFGWRLPLVGQTALAGALVLALTFSGVYLYRQRHQPSENPGTVAKNPLLNDRALAEVQRTENQYMQAIDKLAEETKPQMSAASSPLMDNYREKLLVLDSAIDELRSQEGQNPSNAHLRYQLLAMYREKQGTLQEVLESKQ